MFKIGQVLMRIDNLLGSDNDIKIIDIRVIKLRAMHTNIDYTFKNILTGKTDEVRDYILKRYYMAKPFNYNKMWKSIN